MSEAKVQIAMLFIDFYIFAFAPISHEVPGNIPALRSDADERLEIKRTMTTVLGMKHVVFAKSDNNRAYTDILMILPEKF